MTKSAKLKFRISEDVEELWNDIDVSGPENAVRVASKIDDDEDVSLDPTYEMVLLRRANKKCQSLEEFVANSREMFKLQVFKPGLSLSGFILKRHHP